MIPGIMEACHEEFWMWLLFVDVANDNPGPRSLLEGWQE